MTMGIVLGALALVLFGVAKIIRNYNLPEVAKARASRAIERQRQRTERLKIRRNKPGV